jgi:hypothetical protein
MLGSTAACRYDNDDRCDAHQVFDGEQNVCLCEPGYALIEQKCVRCRANETAVGNTCQCELGYQRTDAGTCLPGPSGLGEECDPKSNATAPSECPPAFPFCALASTGEGYCTQNECDSTDDCAEGYTCAIWEETPFCQRPPTGFGDECETNADCEGKEADFCETLISKACLVSGCDLELKNCADGFECCDISAFGIDDTLCVPNGECP